ncbi:MAG: Tab2 family RNA-binding protein, partial [Prochlorothrix sp.]
MNHALPPQPLPDDVMGEQWQFVTVPAGEVTHLFEHRPIPIQVAPPDRWPLGLGLASTEKVPGLIIQGGRRSRRLAQWVQAQGPIAITAMATDPGGLILEAADDRRWVFATFTDAEVIQSAQMYQMR